MTEEQKRAIYEYMYEELKGKVWHLVPGSCSACGLPWTEARYTTRAQGRDLDTWMSLPPLDMNTAFALAIPKLQAEGVKVMWNNMGGEWWFDPPSEAAEVIQTPDFWPGVLDYIKAVHP